MPGDYSNSDTQTENGQFLQEHLASEKIMLVV